MKKTTALILAAALVLALTGCAPSAPEYLSTGSGNDINVNHVTDVKHPSGITAAADFGIRLLQNTMESSKNTVLSPLSVLYALAMTANGADGQTLAQMEAVLGLDAQTLNEFVSSYAAALPEGALRLANSIWLTNDDRFTVNEDFLQRSEDHFRADFRRTAMDEAARQAINEWVKEKTDGMIPQTLDSLPQETIMCLINALAFDAKWEDAYQEHQVKDAVFTAEDGTETDIEMMRSDELGYLEDEHGTGFIKYYEGRDHAFVALLPNDGISIADYVSGLTGESLLAMLSTPQSILVETGLPKFECEYSTELNEILKTMGMTDAFDPMNADFSRMGNCETGNIYISQVIHKSFISVAEKGTRAGAVTAVVAPAAGALNTPDYKAVILDRPFVYLLIDTETNLPFFMGTMMEP